MENEDEVHTEGEVGGESGEDEEEGRRGRQRREAETRNKKTFY